MTQTNINIRMDDNLKQQLDPFYCESNMAHLRRSIQALNSGKGVEHDIIEVENE